MTSHGNPVYAENENRAYPFEENLDATVNGTRIPNGLLVGLRISETEAAPGPVSLVSVLRSGVYTTLVFDLNGVERTVTFHAAAQRYAAHSETSPGCVIVFVLGNGSDAFDALEDGEYPVSGIARVERGVCSFMPARLESVKGGAGTALSGDILLREGYNCRIVLDAAGKRFTVAPVYGEGRGVSCDIPVSDLCGAGLERLNGLDGPDVAVAGIRGVKVAADGGVLRISASSQGDCT